MFDEIFVRNIMTHEIKYVFEIPVVKGDKHGFTAKPATQKDINHLEGISNKMRHWYENTILNLEGLVFYGVKFTLKHHAWCRERQIDPFNMTDSDQTQFKLTFGDDMN